MRTWKTIFILMIGLAILVFSNPVLASGVDCRTGTKIWWGKTELKSGQIGRVTVLKDTKLFKPVGEKKEVIRNLKAGEQYRVYAFKSNMLNVGGGLFVDRNANIKYETPSKSKLQQLACIKEYDAKLKNQAEQMIVVKSSQSQKTSATLQTYEKQNGQWVAKTSPVSALIGKAGTGKTREGDGKTPVGTYELGTAFGWGSKPAGMKYSFKPVTKNDYWVDDVRAKEYNQWVRYTGNPSSKWASFEKLHQPLYKYGVVIRYNEDPIVKGEGSAIFLHLKTTATRYTLGCVAIDEQHLVKILKWLDPTKNPILVIE